MKLKDYLYKTPEMTEEKLLELIDANYLIIGSELITRINYLHKEDFKNTSKNILKEFDLIQDKQSYLTKSQRNKVIGLVGICLIKMTKNDAEL